MDHLLTTRDHARLPAELVRLLAPQERYDALRRRTRRKAGAALCDLAYANVSDGADGADGAAVQAIRDAIAEDPAPRLQYTPHGGATTPRRLVAGQLSRLHGRAFHHRDVVLTPGAMAGLNIVFRSLRTICDDEVIVVTPCWIDYPVYLAQLGIRAVTVDVDPETMHLDLAAIRDALSPHTRAVILSQPSNPTGVIHTRAELGALAELLLENPHGPPPLLISDESLRDVTFGDARSVSPVEYYARTCIVYSFGKSLFIQGQRIGYVAVSPEMPDGRAFATELVQWSHAMGFCAPTSLMQHALPRLLELRPDLSRLAARRARAVTALQAAGYELPPSDATFYLYPRTPEGEDFAFAERLAGQGLLVLPAPVFHHCGHFRLSMTAPDLMVDLALRVLGEQRGYREPVARVESLAAVG
jgi:aspartate aminotransferase